MNILQGATIDDEISLVERKIQASRSTTQHLNAMTQRMPISGRQPEPNPTVPRARAKISFLEDKRKNLELLRERKDWEIVFKQSQNDHDEIWNHRGPGLDFANIKTLPDSHKICTPVFKNLFPLRPILTLDSGLIIPDDRVQDNDLSRRLPNLLKVSFTLYQLQFIRHEYQRICTEKLQGSIKKEGSIIRNWQGIGKELDKCR